MPINNLYLTLKVFILSVHVIEAMTLLYCLSYRNAKKLLLN